jgi:hypothetical protein
VEEEELTGLASSVMIFFYVEVAFFALLGLQALVESARVSAVGEDKPPPLVWNPQSWGESLIGIVAIMFINAAVMFGVLSVTVPEATGWFTDPAAIDMTKLKVPAVIGTIGLLVVLLPMSIVGLTCGKLSQALSPIRIVKSITKTHMHYLFLLMMFSVLMVLFFGVGMVVVNWFGGEIKYLQIAVQTGEVGEVAKKMMSWGIVMAIGLYSVYVVGRLIGLFGRSYRKKILFNS